jgi:hypothetical protein
VNGDDYPTIGTAYGTTEGHDFSIHRFSGDGIRVLVPAYDRKQDDGRACLRTEDLLLGILEGEPNDAQRFLSGEIESVDVVKAELLKSTYGSKERDLRGSTETEQSDRALTTALALAVGRLAGSCDVLLGVLRSGGGAVAVLKRTGLDPAAIERRLREHLGDS